MAAQHRATKTRKYAMKKRAEQQAETRHRIVEAAVELHGTVGPALTTVTMIAERAGVQRHTYYAHFPDDRSLFRACSALSLERDPLPDPEEWREITDPGERLRHGLKAIYGWYERNDELTGCVLRDAQYHALTRETAELSFGPSFAAYDEVLGTGLSKRQRAALKLATSYFTWRTLVREAGLQRAAAVDMMVEAVAPPGQKKRGRAAPFP
jgi:AcrR family transcriptional regulator